MTTPPIRISKRKLANPIQAPRDLGYNDPMQEAEARKTRYVSVSLGDLASSGAPIQIWTTERPPTTTDTPRVTVEPETMTSFSSSSSDTSSSNSSISTRTTVDLSKYLAKIPTLNDRAFRGKLSRVESLLIDNTYLEAKEPDTPSSLMPRNTLPKVLSPTYVPPGQRGSRAPAIILHERQHEAPIVQAPPLKRTSSSSSVQPVHNARRSAPARRTASAEKATDTPQSLSPIEEAPPVQPVHVAAKRGRGRPRKAVPSSSTSPPRPAPIKPTWTGKRITETPLQSPSVSSNSTLSAAEESSLDNEFEEDSEDEEEEYAPPVSHRKRVVVTKVSPPSTAATAARQPAIEPPRMDRQVSHRVINDGPISPGFVAISRELSRKRGIPTTTNAPPRPTAPSAGPVLGQFDERKRQYSDMSSSSDYPSHQHPAQRLKPNRPLTLTLNRSHINSSTPRLHSPLSQSFYFSREEASSLPMPAQAYRSTHTLPVL